MNWRLGVPAAITLGCCLSVLAGCSRSAGPTPTTSTMTRTIIRTITRQATAEPSAVVAGPTTATTARTCPLIGEHTVQADVGMRLDKIKALSSGGTIIGCRFYPLGHPTAQCDATCLAGEHLPPPGQPAVEIVLARYTSTLAAHNAMVRSGDGARATEQVTVGNGDIGLAYRTAFYPKDHGKDWACAFNLGKTLAVIWTATTNGSYKVTAVARHLYANLK